MHANRRWITKELFLVECQWPRRPYSKGFWSKKHALPGCVCVLPLQSIQRGWIREWSGCWPPSRRTIWCRSHARSVWLWYGRLTCCCKSVSRICSRRAAIYPFCNTVSFDATWLSFSYCFQNLHRHFYLYGRLLLKILCWCF